MTRPTSCHPAPVGDRGFQLILGGTKLRDDGTPRRLTLTVESYVKWYAIFCVHPDGRVEKVNIHDYVQSSEIDGTVEGDHVFNPMACELLADKLDADWDEVALDTVTGRWVREHLGADTTKEIRLSKETPR